jgi:NtrC-family two-component system sensor histidine kinase KinB
MGSRDRCHSGASVTRVRRLETRFLLAGCLLVATTVACGVWSALTLARLSRVVDESLRGSQDTIDLAAGLASALEREDDALLLGIAGDPNAARDLVAARGVFDEQYRRLVKLVRAPEERALAVALRDHVTSYRAAGDALVRVRDDPAARERYHQYVNPLLRKSVDDCGRLRELNFRAMEAAGIQARDVASRSTIVVAFVSLLALAVSILVSRHLARTVAKPIRELTTSVEALREGDFDHRVEVATADEIGRLAEGFNRMADALAEFRRSNLGEVLRAKGTLEATLASLPDAVMVVGPEERLEVVNPTASAFLRATGVEGARALGELGLPPAAVDGVRGALRGERAEPGGNDFSHTITVSIDGRTQRLLPIAATIREVAPGRAGAVLVLHDVSDFARLDELRTELIGVASHELRTPLTTLRMNLMLLGERSGALTGHQREIVATALLGCEQLANTVDELLDLTRIEAGKLKLNRDRFDLRAAVAQAMRVWAVRFEEAGIKLELVRDSDAPVFVWGDTARMGVVLSNLLGNAFKYAPPGGHVTVEVASGRKAGGNGGRALHFAVTDGGPGIAEEFRERIFEKFFRVEHERHERREHVHGAGIGLYLCRQIVEAHEGVIRCEAGPLGHGTRFVVELPAEAVEVAFPSA